MKISGTYKFQISLKEKEDCDLCELVMNHIEECMDKDSRKRQRNNIFVRRSGKITNRDILICLMNYYKRYEMKKKSEYSDDVKRIAEKMNNP